MRELRARLLPYTIFLKGPFSQVIQKEHWEVLLMPAFTRQQAGWITLAGM